MSVAAVASFELLADTGHPRSPMLFTAPVVTGSLVAGATLTCSTGTWKYAPSSYSYQWQRRDIAGANPANIGADQNTYVLTSADAAKTISCAVTATNAHGASPYSSTSAVSAVTGLVEGDFEDGTAGSQIVQAYPWESVTVAVDDTFTYSADHVVNGDKLGAKLVLGTTNNTTRIVHTFPAAMSTHGGRFYLWMDALPAQVLTVFVIRNGSTVLARARIQVGASAGKLIAQTGTVVGSTPTTAIPTGQWVRIDYEAVHATSGTFTTHVFIDPTSNTVDAAYTSTVSADTGGGAAGGLAADSIALGDTQAGITTAKTFYFGKVLSQVATYGGAAPNNTVAPAVSGTVVLGQTLTTTNGTWTGTAPDTYSYQWQRSSDAGVTWADISGETASTHVVSAADIGDTIRVRVNAFSVTAGTGRSYSSATTAATTVTAAAGYTG